MSFFIEIPSEETVVLFSTHKDNEPFKRYLSELGGTFCRELATQKGTSMPAWVFEAAKKADVEAFVAENDDNESVASLPDVELMFDEIFRRIESLEKMYEQLYEMMSSRKR
jgi:hypothetical protein